MSVAGRAIVLKARPVPGPLVPSDVFQEISETVSLTPRDGEVVVKVLYISVDPAMRGWMSDRKSYIPPVALNSVMRAHGAGIILSSASRSLPPGTYVTGPVGFRTHAVLPASLLTPTTISTISTGSSTGASSGPSDGASATSSKTFPTISTITLPLPAHLGPLGMTGLTAYFGLLDVGRPLPGDTVLVSGAAGATGSIVGQIARLMGCHVIGLAGSDEKCEWLVNDLGFHVAINYRKAATKKGGLMGEIGRAAPRGLDVFFDNVGGDVMQAGVGRMAKNGRVVVCGAISQYEEDNKGKGSGYGGQAMMNVIAMRLKMQGFIVFDYESRYAEARERLAQWVSQGQIKYTTTIVDGFENCGNAVAMLFKGDNTGKLLVKVAEDEKARL